METEREKFEKWYSEEFLAGWPDLAKEYLEKDEGDYVDDGVHNKWIGWQAKANSLPKGNK
jgi:hypothetical protein